MTLVSTVLIPYVLLEHEHTLEEPQSLTEVS